jgi:HD-GYP domain-containing protein (c-di-GMP phosphodiesterase class II)
MLNHALQAERRSLVQAVRMARSIVSLIGLRDQYTASHCGRVETYSRTIAKKLQLSDDEIETIGFAASLHDLGKVAIPDHILLKPGELTEEEFAWIQQYPVWGWTTLHEFDEFDQAALLVLHQHERVDGRGYPRGLRGKQIPLGSRIINVADSYDAMRTTRPYRKGLSEGEALAELMRCAGTQFDPEVVEAFVCTVLFPPALPDEPPAIPA